MILAQVRIADVLSCTVPSLKECLRPKCRNQSTLISNQKEHLRNLMFFFHEEITANEQLADGAINGSCACFSTLHSPQRIQEIDPPPRSRLKPFEALQIFFEPPALAGCQVQIAALRFGPEPISSKGVGKQV